MRLHAVVLTLAVALAACGDNLPGDRPPTAANQAVTTAEDTPVEVTIDASDPEGGALTFAASTPAHGTVTIAGATLTYTPAADYNGPDAVTVTVTAGAQSATAAVTITVTPVNDAPVAVDDDAATGEDTPATLTAAALLANDTDVDGDALTITAVGDATDGAVALAGDTVTFTPAANFTGDATFTYTVSDGTLTDTGTVTVTVGGANDPPVAVDDTATTPEDTAAVIAATTLVANDTDADGDALSVTAVANATNGTVALAGGDVTFTPSADFNGTASFEYTVSDGAATATGLVTVTVTPVNDAPVAVDDAVTTAEDTAATITAATLLANDTDVDGPTLTVTAVAAATNGTVALAGTTVTFTPAANFNGTAGFDYTVSDGTLTDTGHVTVTVTPVNDAPVAVDDAGATSQDLAVTFTDATLLANDTDVDGPALAITAVGAAVNGTVSRAAGVTTFTPSPGFTGLASFEYTVSDGALTDVGLVRVSVGNVNDPPVAVDDSVTTDEDVPAVIAAAALTSNDTDPDLDPLSVAAVSNPTNGTVSLTLGVITFTPAPDVNGTGGFDYTVTDGVLTDVGHVTVTITPVDDVPVAVADAVTLDEDTAATTTVLANDTGLGDGGLVVTVTTAPTHGTATVEADGSITYVPAADYAGADSYAYTVTDADGDTATATVGVTINPINDAPVALAQSASTNAGAPVTLTLAATDVDSASVTFAVAAAPAHGTLGAITPASAFTATVVYTPAAGYSGPDGFTFTATDGALTSAAAAVTLTINAVAPVVVSTAPADAATAVSPLTTVAVTFDLAMTPATLTTQTTAGPCTGALQVSSDDFASCVAFAGATAVMSAGDTVATATPAPALANGTAYKIRVTTAAQSAGGTGLASTFTQATGFTTSVEAPCATGLVISQVYGGGGNAGAPFNRDFVVLHNGGTAAVSTAGMAIQYASAAGTTWSVTALPTATVPAGGYLLVAEASGGAVGAALPTPEVTGTINMSGTNGKVALTSSITPLTGSCPTAGVVDFVGFGTANCFEGAAAAPAPSNITAIQRRNNGCSDGANNATDFGVIAPDPRNSATAPAVCACTANETNQPYEADYCALQFPPTLTAVTGATTGSIFARLFEAGVTEAGGANPIVRSQVGFGPASVNPENQAGFTWVSAAFNVQAGNDDEYQAQFTAPAPGSYRYASRFSLDGVNWTYCDLDGAGSNAGLSFSPSNLGVLTVTP
ncbi:MAG: Ig-like domain-containing protein [Kofleriaceae bacterium]